MWLPLQDLIASGRQYQESSHPCPSGTWRRHPNWIGRSTHEPFLSRGYDRIPHPKIEGGPTQELLRETGEHWAILGACGYLPSEGCPPVGAHGNKIALDTSGRESARQRLPRPDLWGEASSRGGHPG